MERRGLDTAAFWGVATWAVGGGFVGARLLHVIDRWPDYASDPLRALAVQRGGLAIEGAILGGLVGGALAARRYKLPVLSVADAVAPGLVLGQAIGRLGCLVTGDALGGVTTLPWGITYLNPYSMAPATGVAYQPVFAYEALWDVAVFGALWMMRGNARQPGSLFAAYLALYATGKFLITFLRQEQVWVLGLQEAQLVALLLIAGGAALWLRGRSGNARLANRGHR